MCKIIQIYQNMERNPNIDIMDNYKNTDEMSDKQFKNREKYFERELTALFCDSSDMVVKVTDLDTEVSDTSVENVTSRVCTFTITVNDEQFDVYSELVVHDDDCDNYVVSSEIELENIDRFIELTNHDSINDELYELIEEIIR